jgi:DnaK suppressor protein
MAARMLAAMSTLNTTQRRALHASLQQREQQLLLEISHAQDEQTQQAQDTEDLPREPDADQSTDRSDREVRHAEKLRDQHELAAVRAALQRMEDGSYGECTDCGKAIALERLKASPAAMRCIACQTKAENKAAGKA